jgi:predicted nucleic acid-binding protein
MSRQRRNSLRTLLRGGHAAERPYRHPRQCHVRRSGSPRGAHDLIIAAHAAETGRLVLTRVAKARFNDLPGVTALDA